MSAFLLRDILWLRGLAILSSLVWISASIGTDFVSSVFWNVIFITINSWQIIALLRDNQTVAFNEEEKNLYHGLFENFKPGEFLKIVRPILHPRLRPLRRPNSASLRSLRSSV